MPWHIPPHVQRPLGPRNDGRGAAGGGGHGTASSGTRQHALPRAARCGPLGERCMLLWTDSCMGKGGTTASLCLGQEGAKWCEGDAPSRCAAAVALHSKECSTRPTSPFAAGAHR